MPKLFFQITNATAMRLHRGDVSPLLGWEKMPPLVIPETSGQPEQAIFPNNTTAISFGYESEKKEITRITITQTILPTTQGPKSIDINSIDEGKAVEYDVQAAPAQGPPTVTAQASTGGQMTSSVTELNDGSFLIALQYM